MRHALTFLSGFTLVGVLAGCPDPDVEYEDFTERHKKLNPTTSPATTVGAGGGCAAPLEGEIDGTWFFLLSPTQSANKPAPLKAAITSTVVGDTLEMNWELTPLDADDRMTEVAPSFTKGPFTVTADGMIDADFGEITAPGETNPLTDSDLVVLLEISGQFCNRDCNSGALGGMVTAPLEFALEGDWALHREESYMEPIELVCGGRTAQ